MTTTSAPLSPLARNWFWPALLAVAAVGGSWALACVTPFAAFAAMLATTESRSSDNNGDGSRPRSSLAFSAAYSRASLSWRCVSSARRRSIE